MQDKEDKIATVIRLSRWTDLAREDFHEMLSPECEYINVPLPAMKCIGPDQTHALLAAMAKDWIMTDLEVTHVACDGDVVLIERTERFQKRSDGSSFELPSMGAFEFANGKIERWRDYFDLNHIKPLLDQGAG